MATKSKPDTRDNSASIRRRERVITTIANGQDVETRRLAALQKKFSLDPATLYPGEKAGLKRLKKALAIKAGVGAPQQLAQFHKWIAVHFLWERAQPRGKAIIAYVNVSAAWGVTTTTIKKAVKAHGALAATLVGMPDIKGNVDVMAQAYKGAGTEAKAKPN